MCYTSHGPTSQGKNMVVKAAKYSRENLEGGIITLICPTEWTLWVQTKVKLNKFTLYSKNTLLPELSIYLLFSCILKGFYLVCNNGHYFSRA